MSRIEEIPHLKSAFRQMDHAGKMALVTRLRDITVPYLGLLKAKVERPISTTARKAYQDKGIGLEWNLAQPSDAAQFCHIARKHPFLSPEQKRYLDLLYACSRALEENSLSDIRQDAILSAYGALDIPDVELGNKHRISQSQKAKKSRGKGDYDRTLGDLINELAKKSPSAKPSELWPAFGTSIAQWADDCKLVKIGNKQSYHYRFGDKHKSISYIQFGVRLREYKK